MYLLHIIHTYKLVVDIIYHEHADAFTRTRNILYENETEIAAKELYCFFFIVNVT